jgi:hypothetical protein
MNVLDDPRRSAAMPTNAVHPQGMRARSLARIDEHAAGLPVLRAMVHEEKLERASSTKGTR